MLYSRPLLEAISKGKVNHGDVSMKLKYMGIDEQTAKLYIFFHCNKRVAKRVKNFFSQPHVLEELSPHFLIHIVDTGLVSLASLSTIAVRGHTGDRRIMCGRTIVLEGQRGLPASVATLGGIIMAEFETSTTLYGIAAGHAVARVYGHSYYDLMKPNTASADGAESDDTLSSNEDECQGDDVGVEITPMDPQIGWVEGGRLPPVQVDHDWALISGLLTRQGNILCDDMVSPGKELFCKQIVSLERRDIKDVVVITGRGLQRGKLAANGSAILSRIGTAFVCAFDFTPSAKSKLLPGDSGAWVVHENTGEVYGHVVSSDSFGEAYVMPIQGTLDEIRSHIKAESVRLPSDIDVEAHNMKTNPWLENGDSGYATMGNTPT